MPADAAAESRDLPRSDAERRALEDIAKPLPPRAAGLSRKRRVAAATLTMPLGLLGVDTRVVWGVVAIFAGIVLGRALRRYGERLDERRPNEERELMQLRSRETMIVLVATAIPYATTIIVLIVLASFFLPAAAFGGSAFVAVVVGFAAQRFLMDVMAGILIAFERWYAVGDFVVVNRRRQRESSSSSACARPFSGAERRPGPSRTHRSSRRSGARRSSPLQHRALTTDPDEARRAVEDVGRRGPAGHARFLRPPRVVEVRERTTRRGSSAVLPDVAPTMEWLAEDFAGRRAQGAVAQRVAAGGADRVPTLDEGTLSRYERRVRSSDASYCKVPTPGCQLGATDNC